jgi:hypothetical protein
MLTHIRLAWISRPQHVTHRVFGMTLMVRLNRTWVIWRSKPFQGTRSSKPDVRYCFKVMRGTLPRSSHQLHGGVVTRPITGRVMDYVLPQTLPYCSANGGTLAHLGQPDPKCANNLSNPCNRATFLVVFPVWLACEAWKITCFLYNLLNRQNRPARNASGILQRHFY